MRSKLKLTIAALVALVTVAGVGTAQASTMNCGRNGFPPCVHQKL